LLPVRDKAPVQLSAGAFTMGQMYGIFDFCLFFLTSCIFLGTLSPFNF